MAQPLATALPELDGLTPELKCVTLAFCRHSFPPETSVHDSALSSCPFSRGKINDIIASTKKGKHFSVQVKTIRGSTWQFGNMDKLVKIEFEAQAQIVGDNRPSPVKDLVFVFVKLRDCGTDRFFICTWPELCDLLSQGHSEYLAKHGGVRPKRWDSLLSAES
jgi:hypothetical protein